MGSSGPIKMSWVYRERAMRGMRTKERARGTCLAICLNKETVEGEPCRKDLEKDYGWRPGLSERNVPQEQERG